MKRIKPLSCVSKCYFKWISAVFYNNSLDMYQFSVMNKSIFKQKRKIWPVFDFDFNILITFSILVTSSKPKRWKIEFEILWFTFIFMNTNFQRLKKTFSCFFDFIVLSKVVIQTFRKFVIIKEKKSMKMGFPLIIIYYMNPQYPYWNTFGFWFIGQGKMLVSD